MGTPNLGNLLQVEWKKLNKSPWFKTKDRPIRITKSQGKIHNKLRLPPIPRTSLTPRIPNLPQWLMAQKSQIPHWMVILKKERHRNYQQILNLWNLSRMKLPRFSIWNLTLTKKPQKRSKGLLENLKKSWRSSEETQIVHRAITWRMNILFLSRMTHSSLGNCKTKMLLHTFRWGIDTQKERGDCWLKPKRYLGKSLSLRGHTRLKLT